MNIVCPSSGWPSLNAIGIDQWVLFEVLKLFIGGSNFIYMYMSDIHCTFVDDLCEIRVDRYTCKSKRNDMCVSYMYNVFYLKKNRVGR